MSRHKPTFLTKVRRWSLVVTSLFGAILLLSAVLACGRARILAGRGAFAGAGAGARAFTPPPGKIFAGVSDKPVSAYVSAVGKHPAVYQEFIAWGQYLPGITLDATSVRARLMIHITTAFGSREAITPAAIAAGHGDSWLIGLGQAIYSSGAITYIRLMAEMDNANNPYAAYNLDGSPRGAAHSTAAFRRAWRRVTLILRGGQLSQIDAELHRLGMPPLRTNKDLPRPKVAMLWVPQVAGNPALAGNQPRAYWPGQRWVDWVGTDFYSKFPNFSGLSALYDAFPHEPFVFGEYALWGSDDPGFINQLFRWIGSHSRTRMVIYNQGLVANGPFQLSRYPNGARALRGWLASSRFPAYAPEFGGSG